MSGTTAIEWATDTWNPTKGCDRVSPGCDHCYAMTMAKRLKGMGSPGYQLDGDPRTSGPGFLAHESPNDLDWPLRKTKPRLIFVNSMSDLFHDRPVDLSLIDWTDALHWVIAGGESCPGARPMQAEWARSLRDQCAAGGIAFLFKQWGSHDEHGTPMSKHAAGRILDGRTWDEYPERVPA